MTIQITFFAPGDTQTPVDGFLGTPALDQLLLENKINVPDALPESTAPIPLRTDTFIDTLVALRNKITPKETTQEGGLFIKAEEDLSPEELKALEGQIVTRSTLNDKAM